jgi:hypothetical protein
LTWANPLVEAWPVTAYDKLDWHYGAALAAGQPKENAFTHIGFYLAWLIRHDLHDPEVFPPAHVAALNRGEMTGSDLADDIDTKLTSMNMNREGRAFSDARYKTYLDEYTSAFEDEPDYSVVDDAANYARAAAVLDRLYATWVADGRPKPPPKEDDLPWSPDRAANASFEIPADMSREAIKAFTETINSGGFRVEPTPEEIGSVAPELEALIPRDITDPPPRTNSVRVKDWGSSLLNRAVKRLSVAPGDATVVVAMGGDGERLLTIILYSVPGVAADKLRMEFDAVIVKAPGARWESRRVGDRAISWATGRLFTVAFWARDSLVVHVAGQADDVERAIPRLP